MAGIVPSLGARLTASEIAMRQIVATLILLALFVALVGSRFHPADGEHLAAISRLTAEKVRSAVPSAAKMSGPVNAIRRELPERLEDRVKGRFDTDKRLTGMEFTITAEGPTVKLQGVVPDATARKRAVAVAENTLGVDAVIDELAVPE